MLAHDPREMHRLFAGGIRDGDLDALAALYA
jgi:hypothetical protein